MKFRLTPDASVVHSFDMLKDDDLSRKAAENFNRHFEYALKHYTGKKTAELLSSPRTLR